MSERIFHETHIAEHMATAKLAEGIERMALVNVEEPLTAHLQG